MCNPYITDGTYLISGKDEVMAFNWFYKVSSLIFINKSLILLYE